MLYPVEISELHRVLPSVEKYFVMIFDKSPIPIHLHKVVDEIVNGRMQLFLCTDGPKLGGCAIFRVEDHLGESVLNCFGWAHDKDYNGHDEDLEQVDSIARWMGCDYVLGYGRRGFAKSLLPKGYKHAQTVMVKYVGD